MRVLIVEDERPLADAVARGLRREGMAVDVAYDGDEGHEKASITRYDVVVLDRDLPGMHGDALCDDWETDGIDYDADGIVDNVLDESDPDEPDDSGARLSLR